MSRFIIEIRNGRVTEFSVRDPKTARRIGPPEVFMNKKWNEVADHLTKVLTQKERIELYEVMQAAIAKAVARGEDKIRGPN